jgi:uncharacterized protein YndB with AHSA1/START domain
MTFDIAGHLGAMTRTVRTLERDGKPAKAVIASRSFDTDPADVWDALTNPDRLPRWFAPVTGDLKVGGRYQVEGNAGGTITSCEPHRAIDLTWEFGGGVSWVSLRLEKLADGTRLELEHVAPIDPHWDKFGPGAVGVGWDLSFLGLAQHLASGAAVAPEASAAWQVSDEAKSLYAAASIDWGRADIAAGADPESARAAAEQTRAFYSGETPMGA